MAYIFSKQEANLIAQLRGLPINSSKSTLKPVKTIDSLIELNLKFLKLDQPRPQEFIMQNWEAIIGEKNASRACPKTISKDTLIITVANPVVRNELQFDRVRILKQLRALPGCNFISNISFLAG